jgi:uncharacterized protein (TIGR02231 family)
MKKLLIALLVLAVAVPSFAADLKPETVITDVVVYPGTARVTRELKTDVTEGMHNILFSDIKPDIDENSLTVSGEGTAKVKIYGAKIIRQYLNEAADERVKELEKKLEALNDQVIAEHSKSGVLQSKRQFIESIKLFAGTQIPKDMVTTMPGPDNLSQTLEFIGNSLSSIEGEQQKSNFALREITKEIQKVKQELNNLRSSAGKVIRSIAVDTECLKPGSLNLKVSYNSGNVNWYPVYDARVDFATAKANLTFAAMTRQVSGEDWNNVKLNISTARPSLGGSMPELMPWYLNARREYSRRKALSPQVMMKSSMMADAAFETMAGSVDAEKFEEAEMVYTESQEKGTAVVYSVAKPVTLMSDGSEQRVPISSQDLDSEFEYAATPKLSPYAYLKAIVQNGNDDRLLPGQINIFLDGDFVGKSNMNETVAAGEKFDLFLGVDEGVSVERELIEEKTDDTLIGNVPSPNKITTHVYKITVENFKNKEIKLNLFDQIPVAQDDKIKVKEIKYSLKPTEDNYRDRKGVLLWKMSLKPAEKKEITYSFVIEHPRNLDVQGI